LAQLENLTDIDFNTCGPVMVTPELLDSLASAAPLLQTYMPSEPMSTTSLKPAYETDEFLITLQDVMRFLGRCTRLVEVGLAFDARKRANYPKEVIPISPSWMASLPSHGVDHHNAPPDYLVSAFLSTFMEQQM
jgi:hypothetical protein